jgi:hypothetical protein
MNYLKAVIVSISLFSTMSYAHNEEVNSHGCHDGKLSYHCHGDSVASSKKTIDRKIVLQPEMMQKERIIDNGREGGKVILWKEGYENKDYLMIKSIQKNLNKFYDINLVISGKLDTKTINAIIDFQSENAMIRDGQNSKELLNKIIHRNK